MARSAPRIASGAQRARSASRRLIDGSVVNDTPISHAVELGAEPISILPTQAPQERPTRIPTAALDAAARETLSFELAIEDLRRAADWFAPIPLRTQWLSGVIVAGCVGRGRRAGVDRPSRRSETQID